MSDDPHPKLTTVADWDGKWSEIFRPYQQDIRHAHYIRAIRHRREKRILEIGAGSFRDMAALCRMGVTCSGVDFSPESVALARKQFPELAGHIHEMNAFELRFDSGAFDLTYHNGFWALFSDAEIVRLAREQARISKFRMIATVHNAHNLPFRQYFAQVATHDPLYRVRFFHRNEIAALMAAVCRKVSVIPVGKSCRHHEDALIRLRLAHPWLLRLYFRLAGQRCLATSERLLCVGEL